MQAARQLRGRVVAVTGGAAGIGLEIAAVLAAAGARVAIGDLDASAAREAATKVGHGTLGVALDVTDHASFAAFLDLVEVELGALDVLVNNAGVMRVGSYATETDAEALRQIEVNLLGVIRGVRLAGPRMAARGRGHIVTIASAASKIAPAGEATYSATKHAVHGYLSAVRAELRGSGVEISVVMPGVVDTELAAGTATGPVRRLRPREVAEAVRRVLLRPAFEVVLPRRIALLHAAVAVLPERARDRLLAATLPDQVAAVSGGTARRRYEAAHFTDPDRR